MPFVGSFMFSFLQNVICYNSVINVELINKSGLENQIATCILEIVLRMCLFLIEGHALDEERRTDCLGERSSRVQSVQRSKLTGR